MLIIPFILVSSFLFSFKYFQGYIFKKKNQDQIFE